MFEKILVCLDGSELAEQILPYVVEEALHFRSNLVLLQVVSTHGTPTVVAAGASAYAVEAAAQQIEKDEAEAKVYLEKLAKPLRDSGINVQCVTLRGLKIGEVIVGYANENNISLIAIATHGRRGLERLFFGSVADFVLRESGLPILLVKPKKSGS